MGYAVGDRVLIPAEVVEARDRGHIGLRVGTQIVLLAEATLDAHVETRPVLTAEQASLLGAYAELRDDNVKLNERVVELEAQTVRLRASNEMFGGQWLLDETPSKPDPEPQAP